MNLDLRKYQPGILTLDGGAAVGKGTISKRIRKKMTVDGQLDENIIEILDAGLTYRMSTYFFTQINPMTPQDLENMGDELKEFLEDKLNFSYGSNGSKFLMNGEVPPQNEMRTPEINDIIAYYARIPILKKHIVHSQRDFVKANKNLWWILDGRCMGTGVASDAVAKVYVEADLNIKAGWRHQDYISQGKDSNAEDVAKELERRDKLDKDARPFPLIQPTDSFFIWAHMGSPEHNTEKVYNFFEDRLRRHGKKIN